MERISLTTLAAEQLALARSAANDRSAHTIRGGQHHALRQTLLALAAGHSLADHESPGEATLQVMHGQVRLTTASANQDGTVGDLLVLPPERHGLAALEDSVVLLTVVARPRD